MKQGGLTLLELLIAMSVLGLLLMVLAQVLAASMRSSSDVNARNEILYEGQIAQQIIVSRLLEAWFVYPEGAQLTLSSSGQTTRNTVRPGAGQNWLVGVDPFIAMILPPQEVGGTCRSGSTQYCFRFFAYYAMRRGAYVDNPNISNTLKPQADPANAGGWLLLEYRAHLQDDVHRTHPLQSPPDPYNFAAIRGQQGRLLVDYLQPETQGNYRLFSLGSDGVQVEMRLQKLQRGQRFLAPQDGSLLSVRVSPRNCLRHGLPRACTAL